MTVSVDKKTLKIIFSICVLAVAICIETAYRKFVPQQIIPRQMEPWYQLTGV